MNKTCQRFEKDNNQTIICTTYGHGERSLLSIWYQKECLENKLEGQTDSHSDFSAYLRKHIFFYLRQIFMF